MIKDDLFQKIFDIYTSVDVPAEKQEIYNLNKITYYEADTKNKSISSNTTIYEVDLKSAFPSICTLMFGPESDFVKKMNSFDDKLEKNKFIAISLKETEYLKQLNLISKMVITSSVIANDPESVILELKKDGILYMGKEFNFNNEIIKEYTNMGFTIHLNIYKKYIRYMKTSYFLDEDSNLIIKGIFKDRPKFLNDKTISILNGDEIDMDELHKYYSKLYWKIIQRNSLYELFNKFYNCDGNKILNKYLQYQQIKTFNDCNILPRNYLKLFIYPLLNK